MCKEVRMYRVLRPFDFFEPGTLEESVRLLFMYGSRAKVMAGGVDLVLKMRLRQLQPEYVVSIRKLPVMDYIVGDKNTGLKFGAMCSLRSLEKSPLVKQHWGLLHEAVHCIASIPTKSMGTAVGNICVATPASDIAPALIALGAEASVTGASGKKIIPVEDLFVAAGKTVLETHEIVTGIFVPPVPTGTGSAFMKLTKTADDIAKVNVAVTVAVEGVKCREARIVLGSVAATPLRTREAEEILKGHKLDKKLMGTAAGIAAQMVSPITDVRSTADYRKEMVRVLVKDTLEKAVGDASSSGGKR
jgi:aerobic carbon-monoxide dehydrogenase medium subunit